MNDSYDIIIVGLGAMGSASAFHLARAGQRVLGLDQFQPPHQFGSSHGATRIIREAYFEHPAYVPLVQRAYELWKDLESESGHTLFLQTGGLMFGDPAGTLVQGAERSGKEHGLRYRLLTAADIAKQYPMFRPSGRMVAVWEPRAGILFPELAIKSHLELAAKHGADLRYHTKVIEWKPHGEGVRVTTTSGEFTAKKLLLSAGAWVASLLPELKLPLEVERQVSLWFKPLTNADQFRPQNCPVFICEHSPHRFFYGFPDIGDGVKIGIHHEGSSTLPDSLDREVKPHEIEAGRCLASQLMPDAVGTLASAVTCMYTNTPDEHFLFDFHPKYRQVLIASPCSGHGFKFSSVIGELVCALLSGHKPSFDLSLFNVGRLV